MAFKKRKINEDELTYSDNVGISWEELFESGKHVQKLNCLHLKVRPRIKK